MSQDYEVIVDSPHLSNAIFKTSNKIIFQIFPSRKCVTISRKK